MWDLPGPGLEPVSPALAGRFLTTEPPGKPPFLLYDTHFQGFLNCRVFFGDCFNLQKGPGVKTLKGCCHSVDSLNARWILWLIERRNEGTAHSKSLITAWKLGSRAFILQKERGNTLAKWSYPNAHPQSSLVRWWHFYTKFTSLCNKSDSETFNPFLLF